MIYIAPKPCVGSGAVRIKPTLNFLTGARRGVRNQGVNCRLFC